MKLYHYDFVVSIVFTTFSLYNIDMEIFGKRLRELRESEGLSAKALGERINVSDVAIINWENNVHDIKGEYLVKLAEYFHVTTDYLLGLDN